jgi:RIO kinase 1
MPRWLDDPVDPEATTYTDATHGPEPVPDWVITEDAARQYERGALKSGKEADVFIVERRLGDRTNLLAAKRYRNLEDRAFRNDAKYRRRTGNRRTDLAMAKGSKRGMAFRAQLWVETEWTTLGRLWSAGAPVPYPVQRQGTEIMLEYLGDDEGAAPRLVDAALDADAIADLYRQLLDALRLIAHAGLVHGDLSVYNLLVWNERLYVIDFPQAVDPVLNTDGLGLLQRDVTNLCKWFAGRGVPADAAEVYAELLDLMRLT